MTAERPTVLYHGSRESDQPIEAFRPVSESKNSTTFGDVETTRVGIFLTSDPEFAAAFGSVHAYELLTDRIGSTADLYHEFLDSIDAFDDREVWLLVRFGRSDWGLMEGQVGERFRDWCRAQGYDGVRFSEETTVGDDYIEAETTVVFSPRHIRPHVVPAITP